MTTLLRMMGRDTFKTLLSLLADLAESWKTEFSWEREVRNRGDNICKSQESRDCGRVSA